MIWARRTDFSTPFPPTWSCTVPNRIRIVAVSTALIVIWGMFFLRNLIEDADAAQTAVVLAGFVVVIPACLVIFWGATTGAKHLPPRGSPLRRRSIGVLAIGGIIATGVVAWLIIV